MRYTGPLGKSFEGDKQRAMSLQSRARVLVGRLLYALKRQGGKGQQYGTERQDDGSVIHAYVLANIAGQEPLIRTWIESPVFGSSEVITTITTEFLFGVESGILIIPDYSALSPEFGGDPLTPVLLHPLEQQREIYTEKRKVAQLDEVRIPAGGYKYREYGLTDLVSKAYPVESDIDRKILPRYAGHWYLAGKAKQLAQAKLAGMFKQGTKEPQDNLTIFLSSYLHAPGTALSYITENLYRSLILYTVDFGIYFLVHIAGTAVRARQLVVKDRELVKTLLGELGTFAKQQGKAVADLVEYQRAETYLFAYCDFGERDWEEIGTHDAEGATLFYGWKPNWDGTELAIVTQQKGASVSNVVPPLVAHRYKATISHTLDDGIYTLSFVASSEESHEWTPPNISTPAIWLPIPLEGGVHTQLWYPRECVETFSETLDAYDVPLYCFFSAEDQLVVVRYKRSSNAVTPQDTNAWHTQQMTFLASLKNKKGSIETPYGGITTIWVDELKVEVIGSESSKRKTTSDSEGVVSISDKSYPAKIGQTNFLDFEFSITMSGDCGSRCIPITGTFGLNQQQQNYVGFVDGCTINSYASVVANAGSVFYNQSSGVRTHSGRLAVVIPDGNPEAVYILTAARKQDLGTEIRRSADRGIFENTQYSTGIKNYYAITRSQWFGGWTGACGAQNKVEQSYSLDRGTVEVKRVYIDSFGMEEFDDEKTEVSPSSAAYSPLGLDQLFYPIVCGSDPYPFFSGNFVSRASIEGNKIYQKNPARIGEGEIVARNFDIAWDREGWRDLVFAGWQ